MTPGSEASSRYDAEDDAEAEVLKLTVNNSKARVCALPEEKFDLLGYTFGQSYSPKTGRTIFAPFQLGR